MLEEGNNLKKFIQQAAVVAAQINPVPAAFVSHTVVSSSFGWSTSDSAPYLQLFLGGELGGGN